jgi:hypothetical protein
MYCQDLLWSGILLAGAQSVVDCYDQLSSEEIGVNHFYSLGVSRQSAAAGIGGDNRAPKEH